MIVATGPELCQKSYFFLKKRIKKLFVNVLECMLTFDKMQNKFSGIWGDQCISLREQGSTDPPPPYGRGGGGVKVHAAVTLDCSVIAWVGCGLRNE